MWKKSGQEWSWVDDPRDSKNDKMIIALMRTAINTYETDLKWVDDGQEIKRLAGWVRRLLNVNRLDLAGLNIGANNKINKARNFLDQIISGSIISTKINLTTVSSYLKDILSASKYTIEDSINV